MIQRAITKTDCQPLPDGSILVAVIGQLKVSGLLRNWKLWSQTFGFQVLQSQKLNAQVFQAFSLRTFSNKCLFFRQTKIQFNHIINSSCSVQQLARSSSQTKFSALYYMTTDAMLRACDAFCFIVFMMFCKNNQQDVPVLKANKSFSTFPFRTYFLRGLLIALPSFSYIFRMKFWKFRANNKILFDFFR